MNKFQVIVGNIGTVYDGNNYMQAQARYTAYVRASKSPHGRAAGEPVTLMRNGEIRSEYEGDFNPFPAVSGRYGAPMGRYGDNPANLQGVRRLHARRQGGGDGYDRGGAYWGAPSNVWAVWARIGDEIICTYIRASSHADAINQVREGV